MPTASKRDNVFADFESGTYDGWTLEGNCWTSEPYSDHHYPGKITGFHGKHFLCTLHPARGNSATGKATSKEFTIEKPFINFLIGGGNHPREACLNLLVDGEVVRTETGSDSAEMRQASWDVALLVGKKAQFEVVDTTQSGERGYVMVDEIAFTSRPPLRPQHTMERLGIKPQFMTNTVFFRNQEERRDGRWLHVGIMEREFEDTINGVCTRMCLPQLKHVAGRPVSEIAHLIREQVDMEISHRGITSPNKLLRQWLYAEASVGWVRTHVVASHPQIPVDTDKNWIRDSLTSTILGRSVCVAVCSGRAVLVRDIARRVGRDVDLECFYCGGFYRDLGQANLAEKSNHSWVMFRFEDGLLVPADHAPASLADTKRFGTKDFGWWVLPRTREQWELFLAQRYITTDGGAFGDKMPLFNIVTMTFDDWKLCDTQHLIRLEKKLRQIEGRNI